MSNCIIAQSGGPTSVINSSVYGLVKANEDLKIYKNVYAGLNGIEGILQERIINLSETDPNEVECFGLTPSSGLGSCRYKMKDIDVCTEEYDRLINILNKMDIKTFFYVGGNDSMDTTAKLSAYAELNNIDIKFIGIPKTIDNDLILTDHTPGFGSAAKFISTSVLETYLDSSVYSNNGIFIIETMGRDTGWLAASACLAQINGKPVADFIYVPEVAFDKIKFIEDVRRKFEEQNQVYIVASEGIRDNDGNFLAQMNSTSHDNFGHVQLGGVCQYLRSLIITAGITSRVKALELGVLQRCAMHCASETDVKEAYQCGYEALKASTRDDVNGYMVSMIREGNSPYSVEYKLIPANQVANNVKYLDVNWINEEGNHIKEEALQYFLPLVGGSQNLIIDNNLPKYKIFSK